MNVGYTSSSSAFLKACNHSGCCIEGPWLQFDVVHESRADDCLTLVVYCLPSVS